MPKTVQPFAASGKFPSDSLCLDGHFQGNPVVPGAMILGFLADQLAQRGLAISRVSRMKFNRILRPNTPFEARFSTHPNGMGVQDVSVELRDRSGVFASARLLLRLFDE